jgi:hypothetical protein
LNASGTLEDDLKLKHTIDGAILEFIEHQWLLGVHLSSNFLWSMQTDTVRAKAAQRLSFVGRNFQGCTARVKGLEYQSLVQPLMTFGLPAWHPNTAENVKSSRLCTDVGYISSMAATFHRPSSRS